MLIGNVGKEPDVRYIDNGVATATLRLATSTPGYTLPNGTTVPERTEWHSILLWRRLAHLYRQTRKNPLRNRDMGREHGDALAPCQRKHIPPACPTASELS